MSIKRSVEWVGGIATLPGFITGEGEAYQPEGLFWLDPDGLILGAEAGPPGELLGQAPAHLRKTIKKPMHGEPHLPSTVRVASPQLAEALADAVPGVKIVCAPTPELGTIIEMMAEQMAAGEDNFSWFDTGLESDEIASFFRAAAGLFRAAPWKAVPDDSSLFSVTIARLGVHDAALSVIGQLGESLGVVMFSDLDDFDRYVESAEMMALGHEPDVPPHLALSFGVWPSTWSWAARPAWTSNPRRTLGHPP